MDFAERQALGRQGIDESPPGIRDAGPAIRSLLEERGSEYGGMDNLHCAGDLEDNYSFWSDNAIRNGTRPAPPAAHEHCIRMILVKISRIATGTPNPDHYADIQGYAELARKTLYDHDDEPT